MVKGHPPVLIKFHTADELIRSIWWLKYTNFKICSIPLQILFQASIDKGSVPLDWKNAKVIPIFKKGSKGKACNYRPVSLTSVVCKLLEGIIRDSVTDHLVRNKLINDTQHGFTKNRSCQTNLIEFMDFVKFYPILSNLARYIPAVTVAWRN